MKALVHLGSSLTEYKYSTALSGLLKAARSARTTVSRVQLPPPISMICWTVCSRLVPATRFDAAWPYTSPVPLHNNKTLVGFHWHTQWFGFGLSAMQWSKLAWVKKLWASFCHSLFAHQLRGEEKMILTEELQLLVQGQQVQGQQVQGQQVQGQVLCCRKWLLK